MKIRNPKSEIRKKIASWAGGCLLVVFLFSTPAFALDDPEAKIAKVIENQVIAAHPNWAELEIRVTFKFADKIFEGLRGLSDKAAFKIVEVYQDFRPVGNVIFPIKVTDGDRSRKIFVRARVEVFKPLVVAKRRIKRGETISGDDLAVEQRDIAMLPQRFFEDKIMVVDTVAKTAIPKNSTIFRWMVKEIPLVSRGDEVMILVRGANLLIKASGTALMDGYLGRKIKVRRKDARNRKSSLEGVLISSNEVEVRIK